MPETTILFPQYYYMRYILLILISVLGTVVAEARDFKADSIEALPIVPTAYVEAMDKVKEPKLYKKTRYWKRSKVCMITGISSMVVGAGGMAGGFIGAVAAFYDGKDDRTGSTMTAIFYTGAGLFVAGTSLLIYAIYARHKAKASVNITMGGTGPQPPLPLGTSTRQPTLTVSINL